MVGAPIIHVKKKSSSSNKRIKQTPNNDGDRLSELPDSLLIRILSRLDLKEAAITGALSRRWQFLWAELPELEFRFSYRGSSSSIEAINERLRRFAGWVNRTLVIRSGNNHLDKFLVDFWYEKCFAPDVNLWVGFAVRNKVKDVELMLSSYGDLYVLPQMFYSNSALTRLHVKECVVAPRRTVEWGSLTWLHFENVELHDRDVDAILSGCPVLYELVLKGFWGLTRLDVNNPSLRSLTIHDEGDESESMIEISAPYIHFLKVKLSHCAFTRELRLANVSSLVRAAFEFEIDDYDYISVNVMGYAQELFGNLQHVEELALGTGCIEVLSAIAEKGGWKLPLSRLRDLTVNAWSYSYSIHGILFLLKSSPLLERLTITGNPVRVDSDYEHLDPDEFKKRDFSFHLLHLKTIYITKFIDFPYQDGEPMLTMVKILLARASDLRKMVIDLGDFSKNFHPSDASSEYIKIAETLLSYPRASTEAVVLLR